MPTKSRRKLNVRLDRGWIVPPASSFTTPFVADADGMYAPASDELVLAEAMRIIATRVLRRTVLSNPQNTRDYLVMRFRDLQHEVFTCIFIDNRNRIITCEELFRGTVDGASVHPREVVKRALFHNAASVIFAHNHPSGCAEPSPADQLITRRLKEALSLIDVRVLDHLVVGGAEVESFAQLGLL